MDIKLPPLGEGADSGVVVNVFVKVGDEVAVDQPLIELENEKAVATIPATAAGRVTAILVKAGDKISVGQPLVTVDGAAAGGKAGESVSADRSAPPSKLVEAPRAAPQTSARPEAGEEVEPAYPAGVEPAAAPSIRKIASDLGINLRRVRGSGHGGKIILEDLKAYIQRLQSGGERVDERPGASPAEAKAPAEQIDFSKWGPVAAKPFSPLRQVIARRMSESWQHVPRVTQFDEADVTDLMALVQKHGKAYEEKGARLTLTALLLVVVARNLKKHPLFNSSLDETGQQIIYKDYCHIGLAVDTEAGLVVPVIRDVDKKSVLELSKAIVELAGKARDRKLGAEEMKGGTFTISNQGGIGGGHFTPIVNRPEVAILGLGRAALKAVVIGNEIKPRSLLPLALSYDHRVIDGGAAARFVVDLVKGIGSFNEESLSSSSSFSSSTSKNQ
jgi:pyruvate dehydrogenase E2 component (dihydrolipoamide acetyltransferase)